MYSGTSYPYTIIQCFFPLSLLELRNWNWVGIDIPRTIINKRIRDGVVEKNRKATETRS